ncbi:MAG: hypothetical protein ACRD15_18495 [Vicinamibacterales bacterium]
MSYNAHDLCGDVEDVDVDATSNRISIPEKSPGELIVDHDHW